jgi:hypothetical protein
MKYLFPVNRLFVLLAVLSAISLPIAAQVIENAPTASSNVPVAAPASENPADVTLSGTPAPAAGRSADALGQSLLGGGTQIQSRRGLRQFHDG